MIDEPHENPDFIDDVSELNRLLSAVETRLETANSEIKILVCAAEFSKGENAALRLALTLALDRLSKEGCRYG